MNGKVKKPGWGSALKIPFGKSSKRKLMNNKDVEDLMWASFLAGFEAPFGNRADFERFKSNFK